MNEQPTTQPTAPPQIKTADVNYFKRKGFFKYAGTPGSVFPRNHSGKLEFNGSTMKLTDSVTSAVIFEVSPQEISEAYFDFWSVGVIINETAYLLEFSNTFTNMSAVEKTNGMMQGFNMFMKKNPTDPGVMEWKSILESAGVPVSKTKNVRFLMTIVAIVVILSFAYVLFVKY